MKCPHCGQYVQNSYDTTCPRCGQALATDAWSDQAGSTPETFYSSPPSAPAYVPGQTTPGGYGPYGQAASPSQWGARTPDNAGYGGYGPPSRGGQSGGAWPAQGAPGYGPPTYGQYAPPSYPLAYAPPSGAPPAWGPPQAPYMPPPRRSRTGLIVGVVISVVVVLAACVGVAGVYLAQQGAGNTVGTGSATATTVGTATPGATVVYQNALTSDNGGWAVDPPRCQYADGGYEITGNYICYAPAGVIGDATISVEAKQTQGITTRPFGIVLRRASQGNYYEFNVDSNSKWIFYKVVGNSVTPIVDFTENAAIKGGLSSVNVLAVHAAGSHFDFFVNGTRVGQADDSTFASGRAGLAANTDIQVVFTSFKVTNP